MPQRAVVVPLPFAVTRLLIRLDLLEQFPVTADRTGTDALYHLLKLIVLRLADVAGGVQGIICRQSGFGTDAAFPDTDAACGMGCYALPGCFTPQSC